MIGTIFRLLGKFKGKQRLGRMLLRDKISGGHDLLIKAKYDCTFKVPNIKENVGFDIYLDGVFEDDTIKLIMSKLPPNGILVDLGANIGSISLPVCKQRPDIKAICIEASPRVFSYLKSNTQQNNLHNAILVNKAISNEDGTQVNFYSPEEKFGKGSMASVFTKNAEKVETVRLDSLLNQQGIGKVDFMKVDIEGFEYFGFHGAPKLLSSDDAPDILFEFLDWAEKAGGRSPGDAQQILIDHGYRLYTMDDDNKKSLLNKPQQTGSAMIYATKKRGT